jgi:hypothetical protein
VERDILIKLGLQEARQAAKSMEFIRRNLERVAVHLPKDRHIREVYRQLLYDSSLVFNYLHDELEMAAFGQSVLGII